MTLDTTSIAIDDAVALRDMHGPADYLVENPEVVTVQVISGELGVTGT